MILSTNNHRLKRKPKLFVFLTVFVEKPNKHLEFIKHTLVSVWHNPIVVYSNAIYFASNFDSLTDETLLIFNMKQKTIIKKVQSK